MGNTPPVCTISDPEWLDLAYDAVIVRDLEGKISTWNHGAEILYGWTRQETVGRLIHELLQTAFPVPFEDIVEELKQNSTWEGELRHRIRGGSLVIVSSRWVVREVEGNKYILEINRDITQQKRVEDAFRGLNQQLQSMVEDLRRTKEMFRALIESAPDAMVIVRQSGEIVLVNAQTEEMFGYAKDDLIGENVEILIPERLRDTHIAYRDKYVTNPRVRPMGGAQPLIGLRKNGEEFLAEISLSPLSTDAGILISSSIRDVSARRLHERASGLPPHAISRTA